MTRLVLDPMCVLSAWEQMGGSAFSSDDAHVEDPDDFKLDLSSWEARLKPLSASSASHLDTNIFSSLFNSAEMAFAFLPGFCPQPAGSAFFPDGPQVVPLCASMSSASVDHPPNSDVALAAASLAADCAVMEDVTTQGSQFDEQFHMSIQFSDADLSPPSVSPSTSEVGIVPDFDQQRGSSCKSGGSTATSGSVPHAPNTEAQQGATSLASTLTELPILSAHAGGPSTAPPLTSSLFVPITSGPTAAGGCMAEPTSIRVSETQELQQQQQAFLGAVVSCAAASEVPTEPHGSSAAAAAAAGRQGAAAQQQLPQVQAGRAVGTSVPAVPTGQSQPQPPLPQSQAQQPQQLQQQQSGYVRTRAECLERYRQKKARRLYTKKIRYQLRKINADKRPRIKGRFVKKEELAEFLAAQRGSAGGAAPHDVEAEDPFFGAMDSDDD